MEQLKQIIINGMMEQGEIAYDPDLELCQLRTPGGLKCAVGMCFDDEYYTPLMEKHASPCNLGSDQVREAIAKTHPDLNLDPENRDADEWKFLSHTQELHDNSETVQEFLEKLNNEQ